jgi:uncharacterized protein
VKLWALVRSRLLEPIVRAQGSPRSIARGTALGTWLTLTPTVGIQMAIAAFVGIPWGANMPIAIALIWLSNPFTILPLYYSYYWLGTVILPGPARSYADVASQVAVRVEAVTRHGEGVGTALRMLGTEIGTPMVVGSLVIATGCAIPAYALALRLAERRQARRHREHGAAAAVEAAAAPAPLDGGARPSALPATRSVHPQ